MSYCLSYDEGYDIIVFVNYGELLKRLKRYAWKVYRWVKPRMGSNPIFSFILLFASPS